MATLDKFTQASMLIAFGGAVKALKSAEGRVGGYLVMFGDGTHRDLQGEWFDKDSDLGLDWYPSRPVLYHHGLDDTLGPIKIGSFDTWKVDDTGVWIEAQLDLRNRYVSAVMELVNRNALGWSSGSMPNLVRSDSNGRIRHWPIAEGSLTPSPAEFRTAVVNIKTLADLPSLEALRGLKTEAAIQTPGVDAAPVPAVDMTAGDPAAPTAEPDTLVPAGPADLPPGAAPIDDPAPGQHSDKPAEEPESDDTRGENTMNPLELAVSAIDAVLTALGISDVTPEQKQELAQQVVASFEQQPEATAAINAAQIDAAQAKTVGELAGKAALAIVQAFVNQREAAKAATSFAKNIGSTLTPNSPAAPGYTAPTAPQIEVRSKYHDLTAEDMSFLAGLRMSNPFKSWRPGQPFWKEMADKAIKAEAAGAFKFLEIDQRDGQPFAMKALRTIQKNGGIKADEVMGPGQTGYGAEWVPDLWSSELWRKMRYENRIMSLFTVTDMPSDDYIIPIDGDDPTVYRVNATTDDAQFNPASSPVTASKAGTGKVELHAKKLGARVPFSEEENEDALVAFIPELRTKMEGSIANALEYVILHADSTIASSPSGNINRYDAATLSTDMDKWLLGFDGLAHLPLVDATSLMVDASGAAPDVALMRSLRKKLAVEYMTDLDNLVYIVEPTTGTTLLDMTGVQTLDKFGPNATLLTGELAKLDNIPIVGSAQFQLADSTGKISNTAASNTLGRIMLAYRPAVRIGMRRRVTLEVVRFPLADGYQMVVFVRIALVRRDNTCVSLAHNILV